MPYLNVTEVESALSVAASAPNTGIAQLITLPHQTWENRTSHALKIAHGGGNARPGVYFLGGLHAREWGSCDILIACIEVLEHAYLGHTGITLGGKKFSASDIQNIVNTLDLFIFPQANPDGRQWSMTRAAMWRKNRRPAPSGSHNNTDCVGVDLNRNFDFLWNYPKYFSPTAPIQNSTSPCDHDVYIGPGAFSEPETQNVKWMLDQHPNIRFFVDLHSYGELAMYAWGDAVDQASKRSMTFQNPAYDGKRGLSGSRAYKEYLPSADKSVSLSLAKRMQSAIKAVRGTKYGVQQDFALYPTAGCSDDYATSRSYAHPNLQKIYGFTIEWGKEFQPPYTEMQKIMQEISAALLDFCLGAVSVSHAAHERVLATPV
jgi:murein tripeptide amidase MpaA